MAKFANIDWDGILSGNYTAKYVGNLDMETVSGWVYEGHEFTISCREIDVTSFGQPDRATIQVHIYRIDNIEVSNDVFHREIEYYKGLSECQKAVVDEYLSSLDDNVSC